MSTTSDESVTQPEPDSQPACLITAVSYEGLSVRTNDGRRATLAVVDADGRVIASGRDVEHAAWEAAVKAYRDFLVGQGHLRTLVKPASKAD
ncbi:hypothetical protein ABU614_08555 [Lysobacter firmicutimachus]|uniref:Uncharacterized protein n=1 Tax=Lysobacter firmicutimachus TaxID=1792846 RepID=A0AAU8N003_9GAMM